MVARDTMVRRAEAVGAAYEPPPGLNAYFQAEQLRASRQLPFQEGRPHPAAGSREHPLVEQRSRPLVRPASETQTEQTVVSALTETKLGPNRILTPDRTGIRSPLTTLWIGTAAGQAPRE